MVAVNVRSVLPRGAEGLGLFISRWLMQFCAALVVIATTACGSLPPGRVADAQDPFERFNRTAFSFNDALDRAVIRPVASVYDAIVPAVAQRGVSNFFDNLCDLPTALNVLLQGKADQAAKHLGWVVANTTVGIAGLFDPATSLGMERQREDFGQTLGTWGLAPGPYIAIPFLGPSSARDAVGLAVDLGVDPLLRVRDADWRLGLVSLRMVQQRASLLASDATLRSIELDPYLFIRDAYLARRRSAVFDGNPVETTPVTTDAPD